VKKRREGMREEEKGCEKKRGDARRKKREKLLQIGVHLIEINAVGLCVIEYKFQVKRNLTNISNSLTHSLITLTTPHSHTLSLSLFHTLIALKPLLERNFNKSW
jgi:hypothetical protein